mmetsp:Transcript_9767/g.38026  ORF Transcript_9767/g.38026 Transcript_9767/m.38026 type:complete len:211 (-) Transcript_9767:913-1545(-)
MAAAASAPSAPNCLSTHRTRESTATWPAVPASAPADPGGALQPGSSDRATTTAPRWAAAPRRPATVMLSASTLEACSGSSALIMTAMRPHTSSSGSAGSRLERIRPSVRRPFASGASGAASSADEGRARSAPGPASEPLPPPPSAAVAVSPSSSSPGLAEAGVGSLGPAGGGGATASQSCDARPDAARSTKAFTMSATFASTDSACDSSS